MCQFCHATITIPQLACIFFNTCPGYFPVRNRACRTSPHQVRGIANKQAQCVDTNEVVTASLTHEMAACPKNGQNVIFNKKPCAFPLRRAVVHVTHKCLKFLKKILVFYVPKPGYNDEGMNNQGMIMNQFNTCSSKVLPRQHLTTFSVQAQHLQ